MLLLASLLSGPSQQAPEPWYNVSIVQTVLQIIAAFVVLGIEYWLQRREKSRKVITYEFLLDDPSPIISLQAMSKATLSNGDPIPNDTNEVQIRIRNSGNAAVLANDFAQEIEFNFGRRKVVSCAIGDQGPARVLPTQVSNSIPQLAGSNILKLPQFVLDVGDMIILKVWATGPREQMQGFAKIVPGGKFIAISDLRTSWKLILVTILARLLIIAVIIQGLRLLSPLFLALQLDVQAIVAIDLIVFLLIIAIYIFLDRKTMISLLK